MKATVKITKTVVERLRPDPARDVFAWDKELRGFGIRLKSTGALSYVVQYRNEHGRSRRMTVGSHGRLTPEEARKRARIMLAEVEGGNDPAAAREAYRAAPDMAALCARYLDDHADTHKKPRSIAEDKRLIERFILPALGGRKVADVTRADVDKLHHAQRKTPYQANRILALS